MSRSPSNRPTAPAQAPGARPPARRPAHRDAAEWQAMGEVFEGMSKVGLALTVGFTVAAAFCRLVESGGARVPDLLGVVARGAWPPDRPGRRARVGEEEPGVEP